MNEAELNAADRVPQEGDAPPLWDERDSASLEAGGMTRSQTALPSSGEAPASGSPSVPMRVRAFSPRASEGGLLAAAVSLAAHALVIAACSSTRPGTARARFRTKTRSRSRSSIALPQPAPSPEPAASTEQAQPAAPEAKASDPAPAARSDRDEAHPPVPERDDSHPPRPRPACRGERRHRRSCPPSRARPNPASDPGADRGRAAPSRASGSAGGAREDHAAGRGPRAARTRGTPRKGEARGGGKGRPGTGRASRGKREAARGTAARGAAKRRSVKPHNVKRSSVKRRRRPPRPLRECCRRFRVSRPRDRPSRELQTLSAGGTRPRRAGKPRRLLLDRRLWARRQRVVDARQRRPGHRCRDRGDGAQGLPLSRSSARRAACLFGGREFPASVAVAGARQPRALGGVAVFDMPRFAMHHSSVAMRHARAWPSESRMSVLR